MISFLENHDCLKIFHSVRSDATVLSKCLNCKCRNVFDIQIAEKLILKGEIQSYGKIVERYFGLKLDKTETNSNWLKRPLTENQVIAFIVGIAIVLVFFLMDKLLYFDKPI